jgi:hypothetical protein
MTTLPAWHSLRHLARTAAIPSARRRSPEAIKWRELTALTRRSRGLEVQGVGVRGTWIGIM